jgi:ParB-like chromosome segregation protein Spo0J
LQAAAINKMDEVPVMVIAHCESWEQAADVAMAESAAQGETTEKLTAKELAACVRAMRANGLTTVQICARLALSQSRVAQMDRLTERVPQELHRAIARGEIKEGALVKLTSRLPDAEGVIASTEPILPTELVEAYEKAKAKLEIDPETKEYPAVSGPKLEAALAEVIEQRPASAFKDAGITLEKPRADAVEKKKNKDAVKHAPSISELSDYLAAGAKRIKAGEYPGLSAEQVVADLRKLLKDKTTWLDWIDGPKPAKDSE